MARLIDDRGRLFGKINIVDLIVLVLILALAVFFGLRASGTEVASGTSPDKVPAKIYFVFEISDTRTVESFMSNTGGPVKDKDGRDIGTVDTVERSLKQSISITGQGVDLTVNEVPVYLVTVVVAAEGYVQEDSLHVGSVAARAGSSMQVEGPGWEGWGKIVKVEYDAAESD